MEYFEGEFDKNIVEIKNIIQQIKMERKTKKNTNAPRNEIYKECHNSFSALSILFAPKLLDIEEDTAPPRAPKAICCVSMIAGKANVIAANGINPS